MTMAPAADLDPVEPVIEAVLRGDRAAFEEMVRLNGRWVRAVIFGVLGDADRADDVAQQVWTAVWCRIGELRNARNWRTWLYRIARNAAIDGGRELARQRRRLISLSQVQAEPAGALPRGDFGGGDTQSEVLEAIKALPARYREPFVLRHLSGWSYRMISEVTGMKVDSIETRLVRARRLLRELLKDRFR